MNVEEERWEGNIRLPKIAYQDSLLKLVLFPSLFAYILCLIVNWIERGIRNNCSKPKEMLVQWKVGRLFSPQNAYNIGRTSTRAEMAISG